MEMYEIVTRLIGRINPVGETNTDGERFENLKVFIDLVDSLVNELHHVSDNASHYEYSRKRAGELAVKYLKTLKSSID